VVRQEAGDVDRLVPCNRRLRTSQQWQARSILRAPAFFGFSSYWGVGLGRAGLDRWRESVVNRGMRLGERCARTVSAGRRCRREKSGDEMAAKPFFRQIADPGGRARLLLHLFGPVREDE